MTKILGPYELPINSILVKVQEFDTSSKPDIGGYKTIILHDGPRAYRVATYWTIRDRHTSEVHHHSLTLRTLRKSRQGWVEDDKYRIAISDEEGDNEIQKLFDFLSSISEVSSNGKYIIVRSISSGL